MNRPSTYQTIAGRTLRIVASAALLAATTAPLGGCGDKQSRASYTAPMTPDDEAFLKGVDRPATASTLFAMSRMLASQGRLSEAELVLRRCIEQEPRYIAAYNELAELYLRRQRVGDAVEVLNAGLEIDPHNGALRNNLGMCWLIRGEHARALDEFTYAAAAMPNDARPRANMGTALGLLGRYDEAFAALTQIMPAAEAHHNVGVLSAARNDTVRAAEEFEIAAELNRSVAAGTPKSR